jgi:hypothetical protein
MSPFITNTLPPMAYRVWWQRHLPKSSATQYLDFTTARWVEGFARVLRRSHPPVRVVVSAQSAHLSRNRSARTDGRQRDIGELVALPEQRRPAR